MANRLMASWYSKTALTSLAALISGSYCVKKGWEMYQAPSEGVPIGDAKDAPSTSAVSSVSPAQQYQFHISASSLSSDVQQALVRDKNTLSLATNLVAEVFRSDQVLDALKDVFVTEFTENEATIASLKKFLVDDVISDPHVSETLIGFAKDAGLQLLAEPEIWPGRTVDMLKNAAIDGLFEEELLSAITKALKTGALS